MATICKQCGGALSGLDKFCGECGAAAEVPAAPTPTAPSVIIPPPSPSPSPEPQVSPPASPQPAKGSKGLIAVALLGGLAVVAAAAGYYSGWFDDNSAGQEAAEPAVTASNTEPPEPPEQIVTIGETELRPQDNQNDQPAEPAFVIEPGKWEYNTEVISAVLVNTAIPARPNGQNLLGYKAQYEVCVSESQARAPAEQILIPSMSANCTHAGATMAEGEYQAQMLCPLTEGGPQYYVRLNGGYSSTETQLTTDADIEIEQGVDGSEGRAMAAITVLVLGRHVGPC